MRRLWLNRLIGDATKPDPGSLGEALDEIVQAEHATADETVDSFQVVAPPDRGLLYTYRSLAESRLQQIRDLQAALDAAHAEADRLRADLTLTRAGRHVGEYINAKKALLRLEDQLEQCRREHVDRDELERRVGAHLRALAERQPF